MAEGSDVGIEGVLRIALTQHPDSRGSFTEVYRREWLGPRREMVQANLSLSRANVLRGMHFHRKQADYWCVFAGKAFVGLYDIRRGSPSEGERAEITIDADAQRFGLYIPSGVAHGFYAEEDVELQYLVDEYYTGGDEFGIAWDDPDMGIDWPGRNPILSDRDRSNPALGDVLAEVPTFQP